ncbi:FAD-dependent monooxygenase [Wenjunlia tyrosinilytica]|uniref:FAD-dependent oxidoreductase n=1 Tax=Wenjunlia tyrosinilytica TaxID=1544741 RepID=A0A917ZXB8_9ACTN|nr:FAD-dependent monooxygenase [Wenjunlia tyrosinilytica]GGO97304.1 FAD-dependent oxidoreductase [Wenjunlia tyrosinilytica]
MPEEKTSVLIVGGGPTGLSAALFLTQHGVRPMLVERHPGSSVHPRARAVNPRTMELFSTVSGLEQEIQAHRSPIAGNSELVHVESLAGRELLRMERPTPDDIEQISPAQWIMIDQDRLEPILRRRAEAGGADIRFNTELSWWAEGPDGVEAVLRDRATGAERRLLADYLIAADGSRSPIRERLGVAQHGPGTISSVVSVPFTADLTGPLRGRRIVVCYVNQPGLHGTIIPIDNEKRWALGVSYAPERGESPADFTRERWVRLVREAVGVADLPVEVDSDQALSWEMAGRVCERFRLGRVLLAGDAAHVMPPSGAFGASTGIQDAHNLAWKLALVLRGVAGTGLLETYQTERRPVAGLTMRQAVQRFALRDGKKSYAGHGRDLIDERTMTLGYRYTSGALLPETEVDDDGAAAEGGACEDPRHPTGRPGTRAPHVVLRLDGEPVSILDRYGRGFVLATGEAGGAWRRAGGRVGEALAVPLATFGVGPRQELADPAGGWNAAYGVGPAGAVLVRPDGFIAWRSAAGAKDPERELGLVLRRLLHTDQVEGPAPAG